MLSQRIMALTRIARNTDRIYVHAAAINELRERIAAFETNHSRFMAATESGNGLGPEAKARLSELLSQPPYDVDFFARDIISDAKDFVAASVDPERRPTAEPVSMASATAALSGYSRISDVLSQNARATADQAVRIYHMLFASMMLVLAAAVLFIFRPMIRNVARRTQELMKARNEMAYLASHDRLTGLHNRIFLHDHFEHMIASAKRRGERVAVLHLDLDNFKAVNDTYGHIAGDHVLRQVGTRIKSVVRAADIPSRIGGDEFVILLNGPGDSADIDGVASRIISAVSEPIEFEGTVFNCGVSIGISVYPDDAQDPNDLLIDSDLALYRAKEAGRGCVRFFSADLRHEHEVRCEMEADLRESARRGEFFVHYQPQVSLATARITGIEALARWNRKGQGYIPPTDFLPVAEKAGLLEIIGRQVISSAIKQAAVWHEAGIDFGRIAINASRIELATDDFVSFILGHAHVHGLPANKLSVEIVEGVILDDDSHDVIGKLRQLREAGVYIELDDFGTGYASLTHINCIEIDRLKVDERFIQGIDTDKNKRRIVRALVDLARGLDIAVVAEGAETVSELETLREIGCSNVQGYGIAYPMDGELVTEWLTMHAPGTPIRFHHEDKATA